MIINDLSLIVIYGNGCGGLELVKFDRELLGFLKEINVLINMKKIVVEILG